MVKGEDVNDNPPNRGDTVFMCGMILFRVDVGIGKDHATVFLHLTAQTLVLKKFMLFIAQSPFFWSYAYSSRQSKTDFLK